MVSGRTSVGVLGALVLGVFCLSVLFYTPQGSVGQASSATQGGGWEVSTVSYEPPFNLQLDAQSIVIDEAAKTLTISGRFWVDANETVADGDKYLGFSFGGELAAGEVRYGDSLSAFPSVRVTAAGLDHAEEYRGYRHAYSTTLPTIKAGMSKEFRLTFGYDDLPSGFIVYFGTGSTVLFVSRGSNYNYVNTSDMRIQFKEWTPLAGRVKQFTGVTGDTWIRDYGSTSYTFGWYNNNGFGLRNGAAYPATTSSTFATDQIFFEESYRLDNWNWTIVEGHPFVVGQIFGGAEAGKNMISIQLNVNGNNEKYMACKSFEDLQSTVAVKVRACPDGVVYYDSPTSNIGFIMLHNSGKYDSPTCNITNVSIYASSSPSNGKGDVVVFGDGGSGSFNNISDMCWGVVNDLPSSQSTGLNTWIDEIIVQPEPAISGLGSDQVQLQDCKLAWLNDTNNDGTISYTLTPASGTHATVTHTIWSNLSTMYVSWDGTACNYSWNGTAYATPSCIWDKNVSITRFSDLNRTSKAIFALTTVTFKWYMFSTSTPRAVSISSATEASELEGRDAIEDSINNALGVGNWESFVDGQLQNREPGGYDPVGTFDKIAVWGNKTWAFNYLAGADSRQNLANLTPAVYVWENSNMTVADITASAYAAITTTMYS